MKIKIYSVRCITNLHMGNGDINFSVVDNEVERDPITNLPCMYASGIKGALRDAYTGDNKDWIFGKEGQDGKGRVKFLQGNLLFQAVRASEGDQLYYLVTCKEALMTYFTLREQLNSENLLGAVNIDACISKKENAKDKKIVGIDGICYEKKDIDDELMKELQDFIPEGEKDKVIIIPDEDMRRIKLPVIARNKLDSKGISENLWYEEIVPRESIFYFATIAEGEDEYDFPSVVQFGGNASIGYGLTKVEEIYPRQPKQEGGQNNG